MRVKFEATLDDFADVSMRSSARSKVARWRRWQEMILVSVLIGALIFLVYYIVNPKGVFGINLFISILATIAIFLICPSSYRRHVRKRIRKYAREQYGTEPVTIEVELSSEGVRFYQEGTQVFYEWSIVESVLESEDSVDFLITNSGIAAVRNRAFECSEMREEFLCLAQQYMDQTTN